MRDLQVYVAIQEYVDGDLPPAFRGQWPSPRPLTPEARYGLEEINSNHDIVLWAFEHVDELSDEPTRVVSLAEYVNEARESWRGPSGFACRFTPTVGG